MALPPVRFRVDAWVQGQWLDTRYGPMRSYFPIQWHEDAVTAGAGAVECDPFHPVSIEHDNSRTTRKVDRDITNRVDNIGKSVPPERRREPPLWVPHHLIQLIPRKGLTSPIGRPSFPRSQ